MTAHQILTAADLDRIAAQLVAALDGHITRPTQDEKSFILKLAAERLRRGSPAQADRASYSFNTVLITSPPRSSESFQ